MQITRAPGSTGGTCSTSARTTVPPVRRPRQVAGRVGPELLESGDHGQGRAVVGQRRYLGRSAVPTDAHDPHCPVPSSYCDRPGRFKTSSLWKQCRRALDHVRTTAATAGVAAGVHTFSGREAAGRLRAGWTFACIASDLAHLEQIAVSHLNAVRERERSGRDR